MKADPVCRWCGQGLYTHVGACPRIKSVTINRDGSETIELRGVMDIVRSDHMPVLLDILEILKVINSRLLTIR